MLFELFDSAVMYFQNAPAPWEAFTLFPGDPWAAITSDDGLLAPVHYTLNFLKGDTVAQMGS